MAVQVLAALDVRAQVRPHYAPARTEDHKFRWTMAVLSRWLKAWTFQGCKVSTCPDSDRWKVWPPSTIPFGSSHKLIRNSLTGIRFPTCKTIYCASFKHSRSQLPIHSTLLKIGVLLGSTGKGIVTQIDP